MMKLRIYLDTSIVAAYFDGRAPDRMMETTEFWKKLPGYDASISDVVVSEMQAVSDDAARSSYFRIVEGMPIIQVGGEMRELADIYLHEGVFTSTMRNDALHVAVAVVSRQDILVSWNFRHLVNRHRRARINQLNVLHGFPSLEIIAPPEV